MRPRHNPAVLHRIDRRRTRFCRLWWCTNPVSPPVRFCCFHHASEAVLGKQHPRVRRERTRIVKKYEAFLRANQVPLSEWPAWLFLIDDSLDEIPWQDINP